MRKIRTFFRTTAYAAIAAVLAASPASAYSNGCTGSGKIQGGGKITATKNAPFGNFSTWTWDVDLGTMTQIAVWESAILPGYDGPLKAAPGSNTTGGKLVQAQPGMSYKATTCEWDNMVYGGGYSEIRPAWNGECKSTTLTVVCAGAKTGKSAACDKAMDDYTAKNPLTKYQKPFFGWIQTCVPLNPPPVVANDPPDVSGVDIGVSVNMPKVPTYTREGDTLGQSYDDFVGKR